MGIEIGGLSGGQMMQGFGAGFQAVGAYQSAKAQQAAMRAEAQVAANNAQLAVWQAQDATERGDVAAAMQTFKAGQVKGAQRAAMAANGIDLSEGSAINVLTDTDFAAALDANTIRDNAAREAWGYRQQARSYLDRSRATTAAADSVNPWLSAGSSLLTSASSLASKWYPSGSGGGDNWAAGTGRYSKYVRGDYGSAL